MDRAEALGRNSSIELRDDPGRDLRIEALTLALPDGRAIATADGLTMREGESVLLTGPSGSGKSTLFRALSGIWPFGSGVVHVPAGRSVMLLPQKPYLPMGTLRTAVAYPGLAEHYDERDIRDALAAARLEQLADRLDEEAAWAQTLSGGEQQRVAIARALLARPDWLFLDEATASLDEPLEAAMYQAIAERLPDTTVVSIGHRSTLRLMHDREIVMAARDDGRFGPRDAEAAPLTPAPAAE
jgi:putative ATP-binding cassette transporter